MQALCARTRNAGFSHVHRSSHASQSLSHAVLDCRAIGELVVADDARHLIMNMDRRQKIETRE